MVEIKKIKKHWFFLSCLFVIGVAAFLRLYKLGSVPHGMTWDEAAIGYNGFAVLTTRRDEWLVHFPISFKSFGDYKAPLSIYINGISTFIFGLNLWAVRLPFAIFGILSVIGLILLSKILLERVTTKHKAQQLSLFIGILSAFSPWSLHFSRVAFETGIALTFFIWGILFLFSFLFSLKTTKKTWLFSFIATFFLCSSLYSYHSAKIVVPLIICSIGVLYFSEVRKKVQIILANVALGLALLVPLLRNSLYDAGNVRFDQVSLFGLHLAPQEFASRIFDHIIAQFSPDYLFLGATTTLRHGDGHWGVLYPTTFFLVIVSVIFFTVHFLKKRNAGKDEKQTLFLLGLVWVCIGTLPAVIGQIVPHSNRAFLSLPGFFLLAALGFDTFQSFLQTSKLNKNVSGTKGERDLLVKSCVGMFIFLHGIFIIQYLHDYYSVYASETATAFQDGYIEAFQYAQKYAPFVRKVLVTTKYGQPYIYLLFVNKINPILYQGGALYKYEYDDNIVAQDRLRPETLGIAAASEIDAQPSDKKIYGSDGKVRFIIFNTPKVQ